MSRFFTWRSPLASRVASGSGTGFGVSGAPAPNAANAARRAAAKTGLWITTRPNRSRGAVRRRHLADSHLDDLQTVGASDRARNDSLDQFHGKPVFICGTALRKKAGLLARNNGANLEESGVAVDHLDAVHGESGSYLSEFIVVNKAMLRRGIGESLSQLRSHQGERVVPCALDSRRIDGERQMQEIASEVNNRQFRRLLPLLREETQKCISSDSSRDIRTLSVRRDEDDVGVLSGDPDCCDDRQTVQRQEGNDDPFSPGGLARERDPDSGR